MFIVKLYDNQWYNTYIDSLLLQDQHNLLLSNCMFNGIWKLFLCVLVKLFMTTNDCRRQQIREKIQVNKQVQKIRLPFTYPSCQQMFWHKTQFEPLLSWVMKPHFEAAWTWLLFQETDSEYRVKNTINLAEQQGSPSQQQWRQESLPMDGVTRLNAEDRTRCWSFRCLSFPVLLMMMTKECWGNLVQHQTQSKYFLIQPSMLSMFTKFLITSLHKNPVYLLRKYLVSSIMEVSFLYFYCPSRCLFTNVPVLLVLLNP